MLWTSLETAASVSEAAVSRDIKIGPTDRSQRRQPTIRTALRVWLGAFVTLLATLTLAQADKRVAFVVGNGAYRFVEGLPNPPIDARAMRDALTKLGFEVVYGENLDRKQLGQTIARFAVLAREADVALVFYAGHGSTFGDVSYIVPIDAEFKSLEAVPYELMPLESLLGELRQVKGIRLALIDACRNNKDERELKRTAQRGGSVSRGLGRVQTPEGLIIAFATQYGMTAQDGPPNANSPFTAAVLKLLPTPGLDVKTLFLDVGREVLSNTNGAQRPEIGISFYDQYMLVSAKQVPDVHTQSVARPDPAFLDFIAGLTDRVKLTRLSENEDAVVREAARKRLSILPTPTYLNGDFYNPNTYSTSKFR